MSDDILTQDKVVEIAKQVSKKNVVQHSSKSNEHYTPTEFIEAAREVMGTIDLDPATTAAVNKELVKATTFYTKRDDSLTLQWFGNTLLNPPGGTVRTGKRTRSQAAIFWAKLVEEYEAGRVDQAIFVGFTLEIIRTSQSESHLSVIEFPCCFPKDRIRFLEQINLPDFPDESSDEYDLVPEFMSQDQPGHANVIAFLPPRGDDFVTAMAIDSFHDVFSKFGVVR